jgi:phospholipid/cholesterol/gamma-HCH transport system permease protein
MHIGLRGRGGAMPSAARGNIATAFEGTSVYRAFREAADTGTLAVRAGREAVRPPFSWIPDAVDETAQVFRRCLIPMTVSIAVWLTGVEVIVFGNLLKNLGVADRFPGGAALGDLREPATWVAMMVFAGVAGSATAADLGARRVREELDALDVLAIDRVRLLVLPRLFGLTFAAVILGMVSFLIMNLVNLPLAPGMLRFPAEIYWPGVKLTILAPDMYATVIKHVIMGFFVGLVACQQGLSCDLGAEGVGRAVNKTVVTTFFGIWLINSFFNLGFLTLFPDASVFRG